MKALFRNDPIFAAFWIGMSVGLIIGFFGSVYP
jgi:hypothetical protein